MERTSFMQLMMTNTYAEMILQSIASGKSPDWQKAIAKRLIEEVKYQHPEAVKLVQEFGGDYMLAARAILDSKCKTGVL